MNTIRIISEDSMKKILLIEDDPFLSSLLKTKIQKNGLDVVWAADGEAALENLKKSDFDLILLDIILPKKTGFEVLEEMRMDPQLHAKKIPVMIISNLGQEEDIKKGQELGVVEYFIKAKISIDDLVQRVKEYFSTGDNK